MLNTAGMGPFGRASRFVIGGLFLLVAIPYYFSVGRSFSFLGSTYSSDYTTFALAVAATLGFLVFYLLVHRWSGTVLRSLNKWAGAILANLPPLAVFIFAASLGIGYLQISVFTYVGIAMLIAGGRKDLGCEVLSPANLIFGTHSHFACIIFSPIDWAEGRARRRSVCR